MLTNCFGVSMPERWRAARKQVNPSENSTVPERPRSCHTSQLRRMPPPVARKNTPRNVSADLPRSSARRFVGQPGPEAQKGPDRPNRGPDRCASPRNLPVSSISMTRWVTRGSIVQGANVVLAGTEDIQMRITDWPEPVRSSRSFPRHLPAGPSSTRPDPAGQENIERAPEPLTRYPAACNGAIHRRASGFQPGPRATRTHWVIP